MNRPHRIRKVARIALVAATLICAVACGGAAFGYLASASDGSALMAQTLMSNCESNPANTAGYCACFVARLQARYPLGEFDEVGRAWGSEEGQRALAEIKQACALPAVSA